MAVIQGYVTNVVKKKKGRKCQGKKTCLSVH